MLTNALPCYAAETMSGIKISKSSQSAQSDYSSLPDSETLKKDIGFTPKLLDTLAGEYKFDHGSVTESFDKSSDGSIVNYRKGVSFKYVKNQNEVNKTVTLSAEPEGYHTLPENVPLTSYGEISLYYNDNQANSIAWNDNGVFYLLMDINKTVTKDELIKMAKELIDLKTDNQTF